jgi:cyclase
MERRLVRAAVTAAVVLAAAAWAVAPGSAQHQRPPVPPERLAEAPGRHGHPEPGEVGVLPVQGRVYLLNLGHVNIVAQVGDDGILLVDTGPEDWSDRVLQTLRERFGQRPITYIINTRLHPDHVGGNAAIIEAAGTTPRVIAHENTYNRMIGVIEGEEALPNEMLPTSTFFTGRKTLYFNGEPIEVLHQPSAYTDGDILVWFRSSDVIATGALFSTLRYPVLDERRGGSMQGVLTALNRIVDITIPAFNLMGGTMVIPSHGRLGNQADVNSYRNYMTIVRDRVRDMIGQGMTLEQVKAARPSLEYDGLYDHPEWRTDAFLEALYRDLSRTAGRQASAN